MVASHRIGAFLAVVKDGGDFSDYDRIILHHVVTVTALELVKKKAVAETEKRLAGDFFDELIASDLYEEEIARRLAFFGLEPDAEQLIMLVDIDGFKAFVDGVHEREETVVQDVKERLHWAVDEFLAQRELLFISASRSDSVVVLVQLGEAQRRQTSARWRQELQATIGEICPRSPCRSAWAGRTGRSSICGRATTRRSTRSRSASSRAAPASSRASTTWAPTACSSACRTRVSLEVFYDSVLGKLREYDEQNSSDLVKSLAVLS